MTPAIYYLSGLSGNTTMLQYAYSLRRVVPTYTGPLIRVRNGGAGTSTQFDIPQDANGNLDTAYLISVISSANTAYLVTFYDQTVNGKNMVFGGVPDRAPIIVNVGKVLVTKPGPNGTVLPATAWGDNYCNMKILDVFIQANNSSIFIVCSNNASTVNQRGLSFGSNFTVNYTVFPYVVGGANDRLFYNNGSRITMGTTSKTNKIYTMLAKPTGVKAWKNNVQVGGEVLITNPSNNATSVIVGANTNTGTELFDGTIQEILFYKGDLAAGGVTSRSSLTADAMAYYGIYRLSSVTTDNVNYIDPTGTATGGGNVSGEFDFSVTARGVCWSTSQNPTINLATRTIDGQGAGSFTSNLNFLQAYTTYYARAYATNSDGTAYGDEKQFITYATPTGNFILDLYSPAHHAYSLRRLRTYYTGFCLRIRRTTTTPYVTTTTADLAFDPATNTISLNSGISYVAGEPTFASTLGQFCAAPGYINTDGYNPCEIFVVTWYDQSGNNKNPTNAAVANQPKLIRLATGVPTLETSQGKVAVRFTSTSANVLTINDTSVALNDVSSYVVTNSIAASTNNNFFSISNDAASRFYLPSGASISYVTSGTFTGFTNTPGVNRLYELICGTSTTSAYSNQIQLSPSSVTSISSTNSSMTIGRTGAVGFFGYYNGYASEIISFVGTSNRSNIEINMMDYYLVQRPPLVTTADVNYIGSTGTAIGGGDLINEYGVTPTIKGVCWDTIPNPTIDSGAVTSDGTGEGAFTSSLNFLSAYTTYYVRAYATNAIGTSYGEEKQFTTGAVPASLTLDLFPSAHHAYSLRKLRTAYTGACVRVRRTSGTSTEVNVEFDANGTISFSSPISAALSGTATNATTLGQFAEGTVDGLTAQSIFVSIWYDQSGNAKDVTNTNVTRYPRLVNVIAGIATLETSGGKPAVRFDRTAINILQLTDTSANINNMSSYFVGQYVTTAGSQIAYLISSLNRFYMPYTQGSNFYAGYGNSAQAITYQTGVSTDRKLFELLAPSPLNSAVAQGWMNGIPSTTTPLVSAATNIIQLGTGATNYYDGYIQEVIGWQTNTYRGEREMNINVYWQVY